ncbi:hypothetical protein OAC89_04060 [Deltaproteobacteria bacterium]|nr:hypothetical protein [Deltaproteobacteria bacterium]
MTKILSTMTALFLLISGAFYQYTYNTTAFVFLCLVIALSLATIFSIRADIHRIKAKEAKKEEQKLFDLALEEYRKAGTPKHAIDKFDIPEKEKHILYEKVTYHEKGRGSKNNPYKSE